jgi:sterol desaturase/sphingolipid hydroxylase (fatty acid hydroxylase superfamily)
MALSQGLAVGIGYYFFGPKLNMFDLLGANIFVFIFNVMGSNLRHSHVWWSWGDKIEAWFISPAQHQVHHSDRPEHFDRNLGSALAIWDRMIGTLTTSSNVGKIRFGLGDNDPGHQSMYQVYLKPFKDNVSRVKQIKSKKPTQAI